MENLICPFSATLAKDDFACPSAGQVIRRGGTEFVCNSLQEHARCCSLYECLKQSVLPELGLEDDLTQVPHGVLARIQFGGLLGLQRITDNVTGTTRVEDIGALVGRAAARYGTIGQVPCQQLVSDISNYRLARRRRNP